MAHHRRISDFETFGSSRGITGLRNCVNGSTHLPSRDVEKVKGASICEPREFAEKPWHITAQQRIRIALLGAVPEQFDEHVPSNTRRRLEPEPYSLGRNRITRSKFPRLDARYHTTATPTDR